ncbi:CD48 antigen-like isoform X2 [Astatotilapia calliptera]|uniref:CD48 antigen-like isoform X2 n=1 Tax=Astatotilapia calliptera TaxID=8154 RepID=UPI000E3FEE77|nr:CD48 antigen-like isoform X2 [Astatotilapia calliptera]
MESSMRLIVLLIVMRFSASEEVKKNLTGTVGGNITLPDSVQEKDVGFLLYGRTNIAHVIKGGFEIHKDIYMNRLQWDRNSGLFTLTELQRDDSGIYTVDSKTGKVFTSSYKLTVYDPVPTPNVTKLNSSSESCSLLCWVDRETTLLWFKDEQMLNQSSSALSLPLTVHKQDFSSSYRCVAANPAEEKTLPVRVRTTCGDTDDNDTNSSTEPRNYNILIIIFCLLLVVMIILATFIIKSKYLSRNKTKTNGQAQGSAGTQEEVQYSEIQISNNRQGENIPESSTTICHTNLTTVYDKLEAHRMITDNHAENT